MLTLRIRAAILFITLLALASCGFQLRNTADLAFKNLYIQGPGTSITGPLIKSLKVNGVTVVSDPAKADLMLNILGESSEKRILSLSGTGVVREFELYYRVHFRLKDPGSEVWGPTQTIENRRDFSYSDAELLAKQFEEARLNEDMRTEAVRELMRRLIVQKPGHLQAPADTAY